jgi:hypothetical protein
MTIVPSPGLMPTRALPMPPSATRPSGTWESMPLAVASYWRKFDHSWQEFCQSTLRLRQYLAGRAGDPQLRIRAGRRQTISAALIGGSNSGQHDFGYTCYMPERITIENLRIDDSQHPENYQGPAIFANFNPEMTDNSYQEKFPYVKTKRSFSGT